jgi:hypothetical protein
MSRQADRPADRGRRGEGQPGIDASVDRFISRLGVSFVRISSGISRCRLFYGSSNPGKTEGLISD